MQSSIGQNFILFSAILAKGKLGMRRGTWSESNTGHGPCWPVLGATYAFSRKFWMKWLLVIYMYKMDSKYKEIRMISSCTKV